MRKPIEVIRDSGRLEEVLEMVVAIATREASFPCDPYMRREEWITHISMDDVRSNIRMWLRAITREVTESIDLEFLYAYVDSQLNMKLHNYAVDISHREQPSDEEMETIRELSTLWESIVYLQNPFDVDGNIVEMDIPSGWKREAII